MIIEANDNKIDIEIGDDEFIILVAVNESGLVSELDFESGSVFVWDPEYNKIEAENNDRISITIVTFLASILILIWFIFRKARMSWGIKQDTFK